MKKEVSRFTAASEDGESFTIIEWRSVRNTSALSGSGPARLGMSEFRMLSGDAVNKIDSETFKVVQRDLIVRKI